MLSPESESFPVSERAGDGSMAAVVVSASDHIGGEVRPAEETEAVDRADPAAPVPAGEAGGDDTWWDWDEG